MRKPFVVFAAATLAAGVTFIGYDNSVLAADRGVQDQGIQATAGVRTGAQAGVPQGITAKTDQPKNDKIQSLLADATKSVLSPNFGKINQYISQADQQRLNLAQIQDQPFNQKVEQFRQLWKAKYNSEFDIDGDVAFGDQFQGFTVVQGEVQNPALLANWPVNPQTEQYKSGTQIQERDRLHQDQQMDIDKPQTDTDRKQTGINRAPQAATPTTPATKLDASSPAAPATAEKRSGLQAGVGGPGQPPSREFQEGARGDATPAGTDLKSQDRKFGTEIGTDRDRPMAGDREHNLKQGSEVALVNFPEHKGLKPLTVSLVQAEGDQWKIDLPNDLTATDLKSNLDKHLTHLLSIKDQWPADRNEASRIVAQHVMMAMYDVDLPGTQGQKQPGQMQQPAKQQPGLQQRDYVQPGQQAQPGQGAGQGGAPQ